MDNSKIVSGQERALSITFYLTYTRFRATLTAYVINLIRIFGETFFPPENYNVLWRLVAMIIILLSQSRV